METRFKASQLSRHLPAYLRVCPGGPGESCRARPAGGILESLGFCCSSSFFLLPLEKRMFIPLLIARWREQTPVSTAQSEYFITRRKTRWRAGNVGHPLSPHHFRLWALDQAGTTLVGFYQWVTSCCSSGHRGGHAAGCLWGGGLPGPDHGPLPVLRCW